MLQLDIFSIEPIEEEPLEEPIVIDKAAPRAVLPEPLEEPQTINSNILAWQQAKASFYLKLMNRFMSGTKCSREVRSYEITRLHNFREQALQEIDHV